MTGPIPSTSVSRLPVAATVSAIWAVRCLQPLVGVTDLGDQVAGQLLAGRLDRPGRPHAGEQPGRGSGGQIGRRAARHEIPQQRVQLVDQPGPLGDHVVAPLIEQRQHRGEILGHDRVRVTMQRGDAGRRGRVDHVVLAPPAAGQLPHPRGRRRGHVIDNLPPGDQPLRQMPPQTPSVLHRPPPLAEPAAHLNSRR